MLAIAGLWGRWRNAEGEEGLSCTIVVSDDSARMAPGHDRIPELLTHDTFDAWLNGAAAPDMLKPAAESASSEWLVCKRVNRTGMGDGDPRLIAPGERQSEMRKDPAAPKDYRAKWVGA